MESVIAIVLGVILPFSTFGSAFARSHDADGSTYKFRSQVLDLLRELVQFCLQFVIITSKLVSFRPQS